MIWLSLAIGVPQILIGILGLYGGGWWLLCYFGLIAFPFAPLMLRIWPPFKEKLSPAIALRVAMLSIAMSISFYVWIIVAIWAD
jgi:hypothetical protein